MIEQAKGVGEGKLVDRGAYQSAQDHLKTAQLLFVGLTPELKNSNPDDVIEVQSCLYPPYPLYHFSGQMLIHKKKIRIIC